MTHLDRRRRVALGHFAVARVFAHLLKMSHEARGFSSLRMRLEGATSFVLLFPAWKECGAATTVKPNPIIQHWQHVTEPRVIQYVA